MDKARNDLNRGRIQGMEEVLDQVKERTLDLRNTIDAKRIEIAKMFEKNSDLVKSGSDPMIWREVERNIGTIGWHEEEITYCERGIEELDQLIDWIEWEIENIRGDVTWIE